MNYLPCISLKPLMSLYIVRIASFVLPFNLLCPYTLCELPPFYCPLTFELLSYSCIFIFFSCLTFIDTSSENITFIAYCFLLRIILAVGCCALQTASFTLTAKEFPDSVATVFVSIFLFFTLGKVRCCQ